MWFTLPKILIIDDNSTIRTLFTADFEDDFKVETAENGAEGISAACRLRPDVILLDINMPDMSGVEVMRELYYKPETAGIPVVVITAASHNAETQNQLYPYKNFKGFLSKMEPIEKIKEIVRRAIS